MEFDTIQQYFYKLHSLLLSLLLFSLIVFITLYLLPMQVPQQPEQHRDELLLATGIIVIAWMIVFVLSNKKIKTIRNGQGLRQKLEKYFALTIVRYSIVLFATMALATGFFLTRNDLFTLIYAFNLILLRFVWPTPRKVCQDLKLRGDEWAMVYYKKDKF